MIPRRNQVQKLFSFNLAGRFCKKKQEDLFIRQQLQLHPFGKIPRKIPSPGGPGPRKHAEGRCKQRETVLNRLARPGPFEGPCPGFVFVLS